MVWVCSHKQVFDNDPRKGDGGRHYCGCAHSCDAIEYAEVKKPCKWTVDKDGVWYTDCHHAFEFNNYDGPEKNEMKYCPYCGGALMEEKG